MTFLALDTSNVFVKATSPDITSVVQPSNSSYIVGDNLDFTVNFNEAVTLNTTTQSLELIIGAATQNASYLSGNGSSAINFRYTVGVGDLDTNGIDVETFIITNGNTIQDTDGNDAVNNYSALTTSGILVDGLAPNTVGSAGKPTDGTYINGSNLDFTVTWDDNVDVFGSPRMS